MIVAYLNNVQQQAYGIKTLNGKKKKKSHSALVTYICIYTAYLDFLASSHICGECAVIPQIHHGASMHQSGTTWSRPRIALAASHRHFLNDALCLN